MKERGFFKKIQKTWKWRATKAGLSQSEIAKETNITRSYLCQVLNNKVDLSMSKFEEIEFFISNHESALENENTNEKEVKNEEEQILKDQNTPGKDNETKAELSETEQNAFNEFWDRYGHKIGTTHARKCFKKAMAKKNFFIDKVIECVDDYTNYCNKTGTHKKHPSTWLNQECWLDNYKSINISESVQDEKNRSVTSRAVEYLSRLEDEKTNEKRTYINITSE